MDGGSRATAGLTATTTTGLTASKHRKKGNIKRRGKTTTNKRKLVLYPKEYQQLTATAQLTHHIPLPGD